MKSIASSLSEQFKNFDIFKLIIDKGRHIIKDWEKSNLKIYKVMIWFICHLSDDFDLRLHGVEWELIWFINESIGLYFEKSKKWSLETKNEIQKYLVFIIENLSLSCWIFENSKKNELINFIPFLVDCFDDWETLIDIKLTVLKCFFGLSQMDDLIIDEIIYVYPKFLEMLWSWINDEIHEVALTSLKIVAAIYAHNDNSLGCQLTRNGIFGSIWHFLNSN